MCDTNEKHEMWQGLIHKAWEDETFKKALMEKPNEIIEKELNIKLRDDLEIRVHEKTRELWHFVIPMRPEQREEGGLSVEELEVSSSAVILLCCYGSCDGVCCLQH